MNAVDHIVSALMTDDTASMDGVFVRNGLAVSGVSWPAITDLGAGILIVAATPSITHCVFADNRAGYGGAIYIRECSPSINHCRFTNNSATSLERLPN